MDRRQDDARPRVDSRSDIALELAEQDVRQPALGTQGRSGRGTPIWRNTRDADPSLVIEQQTIHSIRDERSSSRPQAPWHVRRRVAGARSAELQGPVPSIVSEPRSRSDRRPDPPNDPISARLGSVVVGERCRLPEPCRAVSAGIAALRGQLPDTAARRRQPNPAGISAFTLPPNGAPNEEAAAASAQLQQYPNTVTVRVIPRSRRGLGARLYTLPAQVNITAAPARGSALHASELTRSILTRKYLPFKMPFPAGTTTRSLWFSACEPVVLGGHIQLRNSTCVCDIVVPETDLGPLAPDGYDIELSPTALPLQRMCGGFPMRLSGFRVSAAVVDPTDENVDGPYDVDGEWPFLVDVLHTRIYFPKVGGVRQGGPVAVLTHGVTTACKIDPVDAIRGLSYLLRYLAANGFVAIGVESYGQAEDGAEFLVATYLWAYFLSNPLIPPPEGTEVFFPPLEPRVCFLGQSRGGGAAGIAPKILNSEYSGFEVIASVGLAPQNYWNDDVGGMWSYLAINGSQDGDVESGKGLLPVDNLSWVGDGIPTWVGNIWIHGGTHGGFFHPVETCEDGTCNLANCDDPGQLAPERVIIDGAITPETQNIIVAQAATAFCRWNAFHDFDWGGFFAGKLLNPFATLEAEDPTLRLEVLARRDYLGVFFDPGLGADQIVADSDDVQIDVASVADLLEIEGAYNVHIQTIAARVAWTQAPAQVVIIHQSPQPMYHLVHRRTYDRLILRINAALPLLPENSDYPDGLSIRVGIRSGEDVLWTDPGDILVIPPTHYVSFYGLPGAASACVFATVAVPFVLFGGSVEFFDSAHAVIIDFAPNQDQGAGTVLIESVTYDYLSGDGGAP